jgi:hypothetical protein
VNIEDLIKLQANEKKQYIVSKIVNFATITDELEKSKEISNIINSFISEYIDINITVDNALGDKSILANRSELETLIDAKVNAFLPIVTAELKKEYLKLKLTKAKNIYELSSAYKLAFASNATRTISTKLGLLLESIASISPYAVNPECEFAIKVKGVDLIAKNRHTGQIEYQQLKTQKNTLTGSQTGRVVKELSIHNVPVVCAVFDLSSWTFNHSSISRVAGNDFWDRIGIPSDLVIEKIKKLILTLEEEYLKIVEE